MPRLEMDDGAQLHYQVDDFRDPWITEPEVPILLHHGNTKNMRFWTQWVPTLARKYRVVRFDIRGFGESTTPPGEPNWPTERYVQDAVSLLDHLGISQVHWVGCESGAGIGVFFAVGYPNRIKSLTLVNGPANFWMPSRIKRPDVISPEAIQKFGVKQWLKESSFRRIQEKLDPQMEAWFQAEGERTSEKGAIALQRCMNELRRLAIEDSSHKEVLTRIHAPTLVMIGDRNAHMPVDEEYAMQQLIPNSRMAVVPNQAHNLYLLVPDQCTAELLQFLEVISKTETMP